MTTQNDGNRTPAPKPRRISPALPVTVLLACVPVWLALAAVWVRSYWVGDSFWWNQPNHVRAVAVSMGALEIYTQRVNATAPFRITADRGHHAQEPSRASPAQSGLPTAWEHLGFGYTAGSDAFGSRRIIVIPFWAIAPAVGLAPVCIAYLLRRRAARRRRQNRCAGCGYSLTGNLSGRCPECGTPAQAAMGAVAVP